MKARKQSMRQVVDAALNRDPDPGREAIQRDIDALKPTPSKLKPVYFRGALVRRSPK